MRYFLTAVAAICALECVRAHLSLEIGTLMIDLSCARFNITMDPKNDISKIATCTSCQVKENKSNYWTAVLFFRHTNGSYIRVCLLPFHCVFS